VIASDELARAYVIAQYRSLVEPLFGEGETTQPRFDGFYAEMVADLPTQQRAERTLELTINRFVGAADYILFHASDWRSEIETNPRLQTLTTIALNAPLIEIRMAGFELYLAQYNLEKSVTQVDRLLKQFEQLPEKNAAGSLWAMAAIAARGVDRERIFEVILDALESDSEKIRGAAVEALARFGGQEIIQPLLYIAQHDFSAYIQERAFCGLAQTGTLHVLERYDALPELLQITRNPESNDQMLSWTYQAMKEISHFYDLPEDPDIWEERLLETGMIKVMMP